MSFTLTKKARPFGVALLVAWALWLSAWNGLRLGRAIFFWKTLENYGSNVVYTSISGAVLFIAGLILAWGLWSGKNWAWVASLAGVAGYTSWYWFDRLILQKPHSNWPFESGVTAFIITFVLIVLFLRSTRLFLQRDVHEQKLKNPSIE
jgi:hypothetical protein